MTVGQLAGLIAAIAFVGLVFAVIWFLVQTAHAMKQAVASLDGLAKEATTLSHQADKILQNTESQGGLARARHSGNPYDLMERNFYAHMF